MDTADALRTGLTSTPKYLPVWYRYDKAGSLYNDRCLSENTYYYFYKSEISILTKNIEEMLYENNDDVPELVDMGSGNSGKTRQFIDSLLKRHTRVKYVPVDISKDFLSETSQQLSEIYASRLSITSIPGDYDIGIQQLSSSSTKIITWLGGGFQNQSYPDQIRRLKSLSSVMTDSCRLIISLDITQNKEQTEAAYLDPTGISADLYLNAIWRLNKEYGCSINTDTLVLEVQYVHSDKPEETSFVTACAKSLENQIHQIPGLGITVDLGKDERLYLHEGKGLSCKYSINQIRTLGSSAGLNLKSYWTDADNHVAVCCFSLPTKE